MCGGVHLDLNHHFLKKSGCAECIAERIADLKRWAAELRGPRWGAAIHLNKATNMELSAADLLEVLK